MSGVDNVEAGDWRAQLRSPLSLIAISGTLGFLLWGPHGRPGYLLDALSGLGTLRALALAFVFGALVMFTLPAALARLVGNASWSELGLGLGDIKLGAIVAVVGLVVVPPIMYFAAQGDGLRQVYPLFITQAREPYSTPSVLEFVLYQLAYLGFFIAGDGFMRGLLLFSLRDKVGSVSALAITTLIQTVWHFGTPTSELIVAPIWGVLAGAFNLRVRSFWWTCLIHWVVNVSLDAFITFG